MASARSASIRCHAMSGFDPKRSFGRKAFGGLLVESRFRSKGPMLAAPSALLGAPVAERSATLPPEWSKSMKQLHGLAEAQALALAIVDTLPEPFLVLDDSL